MAPHLIRLRTATACASCGLALPARGEGWWDPDDGSTRCETCAVALAPLPNDPPGATADRLAPVADREAGSALTAALTPALGTDAVPPPPDPPEGARRIDVRYDAACVLCAAPLAAGTAAWWELHTQTLRCDACVGARTTGDFAG